MTQGFPAQPQYGAPQQQFPPQGYAQPAQPQFVPQGTQGGSFFTQQDPYLQTAQGPVIPPPQPAAPAAPQPTDTSGFFGGGAAISWDDKKGYVRGTPRGGKVIDKKITNQTKMGTNEVITWGDGSPRKQMELTLQTAERADPQDDGQRRLFIKGDLPRASREAMKPYGAHDVEIGAWFYAAWVDEKPVKQSGWNAQKIFKVVYAPPGAPDPMAGQPAFTASAPPPVAAPQPSAPVDQYAAYAAQQAQGGAFQQPQMPQQPVAAANDQQAQYAAWQAQQAAQGQQPPGTGQLVPGQYNPAAEAHAAATMPAPPYPNQPGVQPNGQGQQQQPAAPGTPPGAQPAQWTPFS